MASFDEHVSQAKCNLDFLENINSNGNKFIDWQVTTNFYVAVHVINAFIAKEGNLHFASHELVKDTISPYSKMPNTRLDDKTYLAYVNLRNLSRRSRYLLNQDIPSKDQDKAHYILEKHFMKSFECADTLISFFSNKYGASFKTIEIKYNYTKNPPNLINFKFSRITPN